jgi:hypothetical protein
LALWTGFAVYVAYNLNHTSNVTWNVEYDYCVEQGVNLLLPRSGDYHAKVVFVTPTQQWLAAPSHLVQVRYPFWTDSLNLTAPVINTLANVTAVRAGLSSACGSALQLGAVQASVYRRNMTTQAYTIVDVTETLS